MDNRSGISFLISIALIVLTLSGLGCIGDPHPHKPLPPHERASIAAVHSGVMPSFDCKSCHKQGVPKIKAKAHACEKSCGVPKAKKKPASQPVKKASPCWCKSCEECKCLRGRQCDPQKKKAQPVY